MLAAVLLPVLAPRAPSTVAAVVTAPQVNGDIILSAVIERPAVVPPIAARPAQTVVTAAGETVETLAAADHSDSAAIRWANGLAATAEPVAGAALLIPPSAGALVPVLPAERPSHFATRLGLDPRVVLDYNALAKDTPRPAGSYLQVPLTAAPRGALVGRFFSRAPGGVPSIVEVHTSVPDGFPYGQCTYYAALRRNVTWAGNAWVWFDAANGIRPEGHVAVAGALVVFHTGWFGHVAYVEQVHPDRSFLISEMNYYGDGGGWGRVDHRTITPADFRSVAGFIY
ncbi:MAG: CHAP domain-containing protein [Candidatus Dormibacteria bacterium]